jgi:histidinol-phosphate aminotransferase
MDPKRIDIQSLLRDNIRNIKPYSSARDEYTGTEGVFLDANENPLGTVSSGVFNRYPDPLQRGVKEKLALLKKCKPEQIFIGNGSDEAIDLVFRAFCAPRKDKVIFTPPTYGMYQVCADINDVQAISIPLTPEFQLDTQSILEAVAMDTSIKAIFICSPNNPSGNLMKDEDVRVICENFDGIIFFDEAYIDFTSHPSKIEWLNEFPNLIVSQTFSKAWGMAALRLGVGYASEEIIRVFNSIKFPYNINQASQEYALEALGKVEKMHDMVGELLKERDNMIATLKDFSFVEKIYPSDANFLLVKMEEAKAIFDFLIGKTVIVRDRTKVPGCEGCLRITVGTREENQELYQELKAWEKKACR